MSERTRGEPKHARDIRTTVSQEEHDQVRAAAAKAGLSLAGYLRKSVGLMPHKPRGPRVVFKAPKNLSDDIRIAAMERGVSAQKFVSDAVKDALS